MLSLGVRNVFGFPWIEPPPKEHISAALSRLQCLAAVSETDRSDGVTVSSLGQLLSKLPVDVGLGKTLVLACVLGIADPTLILAAGMTVQSPFKNQMGVQVGGTRPYDRFLSVEGDQFSLLNVFQAWMQQKRRDSGRGPGTRGWCGHNHLIEQRLYEMARLVRQFRDTLHDSGLLALADDVHLAEDGWVIDTRPHKRRHDGEDDRPDGDKQDGKRDMRRQLRRLKRNAGAETQRKRLRMEDTWDAFAETDTAEASKVASEPKRDEDDVHALEFSVFPFMLYG